MYRYNIYFQNPVNKERKLIEIVDMKDILAAQVYAVQKYKKSVDFLTTQLVVLKAHGKEA